MATFRGRDPLAEVFERERAHVLARIDRVINGEPNRALDGLATELTRLAKVETEVLYPAFSQVHLRPETQSLLDDIVDHRGAHHSALQELLRTRRGHPLRKIRALQLRDLVSHDATVHLTQLLPVLRSQMPPPRYQALTNAVEARLAEHRGAAEARPHTAEQRAAAQAPAPARALRAS